MVLELSRKTFSVIFLFMIRSTNDINKLLFLFATVKLKKASNSAITVINVTLYDNWLGPSEPRQMLSSCGIGFGSLFNLSIFHFKF